MFKIAEHCLQFKWKIILYFVTKKKEKEFNRPLIILELVILNFTHTYTGTYKSPWI